MTKEELINLKKELEQRDNNFYKDNNIKSNIQEIELKERTEKLVLDIQNLLNYAVNDRASSLNRLSELDIRYTLYFESELDLQVFLDKRIALKDDTFENKCAFLKENTSNKFFECRVDVGINNDFQKSPYNNIRNLTAREYIDIDKFIPLMKKLGYELSVGDKAIESVDDIIRSSAMGDQLGIAYLNTRIIFEKEQENEFESASDKIK